MENRFLLALLGLFLALPAVAADEVLQRTLKISPSGSLVLFNINGPVEVEGWDRSEVDLYAVKSSNAHPEDLSRVQIDVQASADRITVRTEYPQDEGIEVTVSYRVRVPRHLHLEQLATVNGLVRVRGVEGAGELRTVNGNVELLDSSGQFSGKTTNGNVRFELRHVDSTGAMTMETVNGSVLLAVPLGAGFDVDARSMNGSFYSELPVAILGAEDPQGFRGRVGRGGATVRVRTVNGGIRVVTTRPSA